MSIVLILFGIFLLLTGKRKRQRIKSRIWAAKILTKIENESR